MLRSVDSLGEFRVDRVDSLAELGFDLVDSFAELTLDLVDPLGELRFDRVDSVGESGLDLSDLNGESGIDVTEGGSDGVDAVFQAVDAMGEATLRAAAGRQDHAAEGGAERHEADEDGDERAELQTASSVCRTGGYQPG
ncbi:hypothetical protein AB3K78_15790 [Leucobacter sp. HNU]|uniref:hypothetical protein n=1 Tax=Leucobacter sp. HNU TaxID=3236805 RepID=UPI003A8062C3